MDTLAAIEKCKSEIAQLPVALGWRDSVLAQLDFCSDVVLGKAAPDRLEHLTMGLISVREMDGWSGDFPGLLSQIQYDLQQQHLPYAAKVRLGIHRRT
jgi:hypothetical protein